MLNRHALTAATAVPRANVPHVPAAPSVTWLCAPARRRCTCVAPARRRRRRAAHRDGCMHRAVPSTRRVPACRTCTQRRRCTHAPATRRRQGRAYPPPASLLPGAWGGGASPQARGPHRLVPRHLRRRPHRRRRRRLLGRRPKLRGAARRGGVGSQLTREAGDEDCGARVETLIGPNCEYTGPAGPGPAGPDSSCSRVGTAVTCDLFVRRRGLGRAGAEGLRPSGPPSQAPTGSGP